MASVLFLVSNTTQSVAVDGLVNLGTTIHKNCGSQARQSGNGIAITGTGYFNIEVNAIVSAPATGNVTLQLYKDGLPISGAIATETIGTATTELHSMSFNTEILRGCACNSLSSITIVNTGIASTISNVSVRVKRDC